MSSDLASPSEVVPQLRAIDDTTGQQSPSAVSDSSSIRPGRGGDSIALGATLEKEHGTPSPARTTSQLAVQPRPSPRHTPDLHVQTDLNLPVPDRHANPPTIAEPNAGQMTRPPASPSGTVFSASVDLQRQISSASMASSVSPGSALASPYLAAISDLTPLPSPLVPGLDAQEIWRRAHRAASFNRSRTTSLESRHSARIPAEILMGSSPTKKKKPYGHLAAEPTTINAGPARERASTASSGTDGAQHERNRSISEFVPETLQNNRPRHVTLGQGNTASVDSNYHMQREAYLAAERGVAEVTNPGQLPTPPASTTSGSDSKEVEGSSPHLEDGTPTEDLEIHCGIQNRLCRFRQLRKLGQGTFSTVMLATTERVPLHPTIDIEGALDTHKLVAIKLIEHGPAGGADEERIEVSLRREVEILKSISHPSLIHLKACEAQEKRTLLVLTYCPGGDLFELASEHRDALTPFAVQRMFAELVGAVRYLHSQLIVHRDIKLENVLVNVKQSALASIQDPRSHTTPLVTLTDLGLSRRIPAPPESPLLTTRCGSEDYAAPEILLGQPYDGRQTDAWALGVVLYALMEGRLPFDAPPGRPDRSRNTHRIARCDWIWCRFGDRDGEWDPALAHGFDGAQACVDGLLKKVRMGRKPLDEIAGLEWVRNGIALPGGLSMREEDENDEFLTSTG